jgi:hypothetical protein
MGRPRAPFWPRLRPAAEPIIAAARGRTGSAPRQLTAARRRFRRSPDRNGTARLDPQERFLASPAYHRVRQEAVIRTRLLRVASAGSHQLVKQRFGIFQVSKAFNSWTRRPAIEAGKPIES